ncbi:MAG: hypothetical protein R3D30_08365 [Hyphomicrobiales bacterium]
MRISEAAYWLTHDLPSVDGEGEERRPDDGVWPISRRDHERRKEAISGCPCASCVSFKIGVGLERKNAAVHTSGEALRRRNDRLYIRRRDGQRLQIARGDDAPQWWFCTSFRRQNVIGC